MKIGIIGSPEFCGDVLAIRQIIKRINEISPEMVIVDKSDFGEWIALTCKKPIRKYSPPRPFWVGKCSVGKRKNFYRNMQAFFWQSNVEKMLIVHSGKNGCFKKLAERFRKGGLEVEEIILSSLERVPTFSEIFPL